MVSGVDVDNRIDPIVYWTPGVNPWTPVDANNVPLESARGLLAFATPVTDWDNNGSIDSSGPLSESAAFIREGQSSILQLGVNTPHTQPLTLRLTFSERPAGLDASPLDGVDSLSWDGTSLLVTLSATANQSTPNTAGHVLLQFAEESDPANTQNQVLTYTVSVDGPAGNVFSTDGSHTLFLLDNDTPAAPFDINVPDPWEVTGEGTGIQRNGTVLSDRSGTSDTFDFDGDGDNDLGVIQGTISADRLNGQAGDDGSDVINATGAANALLDGGLGRDVLIGGDGNDYLTGGPKTDPGINEDDALQGGKGDDTLYGGFGHDVLDGGEGRDVIYGGSGDDHLQGSAGLTALNRDWSVTAQKWDKNGDRFIFMER